jgi:hypothetical protein
MSREIIVLEGQTIFDIAILEYGTINGLKDLLERNSETITDLDQELVIGSKLFVGDPIKADVVNHFAAKNYHFSSNYSIQESGSDDGIFGDEFGDEFE